MDLDDRWLSTEETAHRLGVKPQTLYAYVSRGLIQSHPVPGRRASRFERAAVERLASRTRAPSGPTPGEDGAGSPALEVLVDSPLTLLDPDGHLYFRGWDAVQAAASATYEAVAEWLWTSTPTPVLPWSTTSEARETGTVAQAALPRAATPVDRMRVIAAATAVTDPLRHDRRPEAVTATGRSIISALVDCLPRVGPERGPGRFPVDGRLVGGTIAARLWPTISIRRPRQEELAVLNRALVLLADHELAASTLAARVAASAWADPYLVVSTGLGVVGGVLHGASSEAVREMVRRVLDGDAAAHVFGDILREGAQPPGFGHRVYEGPDPRAAALLGALDEVYAGSPAWQAGRALTDLARRRSMPPPNVDFALAVLAEAASFVAGGSEAVFAVARSAGWIAHAIEEYPHRLRFRPRAVYTGPAPGVTPG